MHFNNMIDGGGRSKDLHDWGQSQDEFEYYIDHFCPPGGLVIDPCTGSGPVPAACKKKGRRFVATEINPETAKVARLRLSRQEVAGS
jgi:methylase of polypeptide subunit release factors